MNFSSYGIFIFLSFFFSVSFEAKESSPLCKGELLPLSYAKNFSIKVGDGFDLVTVNYKGVSQSILLSRGLAPNCGQDLTLTLPLERLTSNSTTHVGFLLALKTENTLQGITEGKYLFNESLRARFKSGGIRELGYPVSLETLLSLNPQVHFSSLYNGYEKTAQKDLGRYSLPVVLVLEYEENHPLGRAEWVKFFSLFFGKLNEGVELFNKEKKIYEGLKNEISKKNPVLLGKLQGPQWYSPHPQSYLSHLVQDAGGELIAKSKLPSITDRVVISFEEILKVLPQVKFYWFPETGWKSLREIRSEDHRYELLLKKDPLIFNYSKRLHAEGGNDYWESGVVFPSRILKDIQNILRDDKKELDYYERIQ